MKGGVAIVYTIVYHFFMTTKLIGVRDFRANMSKYAKKVQAGTTRFIVMNRNKPLFEITPITEKNDDVLGASFLASIKASRADVASGKFYTQEEVENMFGL